MGGNKLFLAAGERLVLEHVLGRLSPWFEEVILAVGAEDLEPIREVLGPLVSSSKVRIVVDEEPGRGPLEGLAVGLEAMTTEWAFVLGCDMPRVQEAVVRMLWRGREKDSDVVCARLDGFLEPLHAFYSVYSLPEVRRALDRGIRKVKGFYDAVKVTVVEEEDFRALAGYRRSFQGMNTPEDLRHFVI